jgi:serine protease
MMVARTIREALRAGVSIAIFVPALALAALADPSQFAQQPTRFSALAVVGGAPQEEMVSRLIVKPRYRVGDPLNNDLLAHNASGLAKISNVPLSVVRPMSGGAHVIRLGQPVTLSEARVIAARLMRDNSVELAEPDRLKRPLAVTPSDPDYATYQWNLFAPSSPNLGSANLPNAWSNTTGSNTVTVAVIDTGYRPHADLGAVVLPGYDFITDIPMANDGNGRDTDAQDPGDWITGAENTAQGGQFYGCGVVSSNGKPINQLSPSSWHGTHVTGIIAAQMNNGIGITGVAPNIQILPVRVLGKCGGYDSDIIDGMRWAAGITTGLPPNPYPAQILNMSLGGAGGAPCSSAYQSAVTEIINKGKVIVVAAGNDGTSTLSTPANCTGVIAVTANAIDGDNSWYATIGPGTTISAPGGDCGGTNYPNNCTAANSVGVYSLWNTGLTTPVSDGYTSYSGTSMATPHVTGVVALMLSLDLTLTPAQITSYLQSSARPHPPGTICTQTANLGMCGAGLLDAYQALNAVKPSHVPPPVVTLSSIPSVVAPGNTVTLSGSAVAGTGRSITSYAWTQLTGATVTISNANTANANFMASTTGSYSFMLTATESGGQTGTASEVIVVSPPVSIPPPMVTLGSIPSVVAPGDTVTLSGSAVAGAGRSITSYAWTQQTGPTTVVISNANTANANFTASTTGSYTFMLTATDNGGQTGTASEVIVVSPPVSVSPPVVTMGSIPSVVTPNDTVTLSGSAVAGAGRSITSYAWTQQTGPTTVSISNANTANANFTAPPTGTYSFMLTATDNGGQTGTATTVILVNSPPVLNAVPVQTVTAGQELNFSVTASDVDGDTPIFHSVSLPSSATLSATGNFSWPNAVPVGNYPLVYYASDPYNANSAQGTVYITVTAASGVSSGGGGGGGGSLDTETLVVLALLAAGLRLRRHYANPQK